MDWPHDPDGDAGSEGMRKFGMAIFAKKIEDADFPLDISELEGNIGTDPIRLDHQTVVPASDIFEHVTVDTVESREEFYRAIGSAIRTGDFRTYTPD